MYEQTVITKSNFVLLGIKVYEKIEKSVEVYDHKFLNDKEEQEVLAEYASVTKKIFGIPYIKAEAKDDNNNILEVKKL